MKVITPAGHEKCASATCRSDMMCERRTMFLVRVLSAAMLATMAMADEPQDNQSMRPVDLKKDGFDITLQALPSGELALFVATGDNVPAEGR